MSFDWSKLEPRVALDEADKALVRRIGEDFLRLGKSTPVQEIRSELVKDRRRLDSLVQGQYITNVAGQYYPAFRALYFIEPGLRSQCEDAIEGVLRALWRIYRAKGPGRYTLAEITANAQFNPSNRLTAEVAGTGAAFLRDFPLYVVDATNSGDNPVQFVQLNEAILDFENLQQAWDDEWARRRPARAIAEPTNLGSTPFVTPQAIDFRFVADNRLKKIIERDHAELQRIRAHEALKSRIVLAGGLIEALLLDALLAQGQNALASNKAPRKKTGQPRPLAEWNLSQMLDVARELNLISHDAEKHSSTIREYRNLVHPGLEMRTELGVREQIANIAEEVLSLVIHDLRERA
jgi:hypothetical protein